MKERYHLVPAGLGREGLEWSERAGRLLKSVCWRWVTGRA